MPATIAVPSSGRARVVSTLMVVVLPAPLGPRRAKTSPRCDLEVEAVEDDLASEGLAQAPDDDGWLQWVMTSEPFFCVRTKLFMTVTHCLRR